MIRSSTELKSTFMISSLPGMFSPRALSISCRHFSQKNSIYFQYLCDPEPPVESFSNPVSFLSNTEWAGGFLSVSRASPVDDPLTRRPGTSWVPSATSGRPSSFGRGRRISFLRYHFGNYSASQGRKNKYHIRISGLREAG